MSLIFHCSPQANDSLSINVFVYTSSSFAFDHLGQRDRFQLTLSHDVSHNRICLLTITFRRFLDASLLGL